MRLLSYIYNDFELFKFSKIIIILTAASCITLEVLCFGCLLLKDVLWLSSIILQYIRIRNFNLKITVRYILTPPRQKKNETKTSEHIAISVTHFKSFWRIRHTETFVSGMYLVVFERAIREECVSFVQNKRKVSYYRVKWLERIHNIHTRGTFLFCISLPCTIFWQVYYTSYFYNSSQL